MLEKLLIKYNIQLDKYYRVAILHKIMLEMGLTGTNRKSFSRDFINRKINNGQLVLPDKKDDYAYRYITGKQIKGIIEAFMPGGKSYYNYEEDQ